MLLAGSQGPLSKGTVPSGEALSLPTSAEATHTGAQKHNRCGSRGVKHKSPLRFARGGGGERARPLTTRFVRRSNAARAGIAAAGRDRSRGSGAGAGPAVSGARARAQRSPAPAPPLTERPLAPAGPRPLGSASGVAVSLPAHAGALPFPLFPDPDGDWRRRLQGLSVSGSPRASCPEGGGGGGGREDGCGGLLLLGGGGGGARSRSGLLRVAAAAGRLPALRRRRALQPVLPPGAQRHPGRDRARRHQSRRRHLGGHAAGVGARR